MKPEKDFCYWKYPESRGATLAAAVAHLLVFCVGLVFYRRSAARDPRMFGEAIWAEAGAVERFRLAMYILAAVLLLSVYLIGTVCRSRRAARLAEGVTLSLSAVVFFAAGYCLRLSDSESGGKYWLITCLLLVVFGAVSFWRARSGRARDPVEP